MFADLMGAIHQRWGASPGLCQLLPVARVSTGASPAPSLPRAVLTRLSDRPLAALNDGSAVTSVGVRLLVFHASYDAATAIVRQADALLDRADFALPDGGRVIDMRRIDESEEQQPDGVWRMTVDFACAVYGPAETP